MWGARGDSLGALNPLCYRNVSRRTLQRNGMCEPTVDMTLYLFEPLALMGGRLGVIVASELAVDRSGLLTELGGVERAVL